jgi:hypothetical protein
MSIDADDTATVKPLHIIGVLEALAHLRKDRNLPSPSGVRAHNVGRPVATLDVATYAELTVWADALAVPDTARLSQSFDDGSSLHSAWHSNWHGWHVRVSAQVDTPGGAS